MQRAKNVPDAFFRFTLGKTSLFAVFAAESRSARFSGARNKSLTPRAPPRGRSRSVQPSPPTRQILATGQQIILPFCAAAVPRDRQTGSRESHEVRTYTNFTSFRLSCGLRRSKNRETAGIFGTGCAIV